MPMATGRRNHPSPAATAFGAGAGLLVGFALRVLPFAWTTSLARWLARQTARPATDREVLSVLRAIDSGARFVPFRIACLERSLGAVLLLGCRRRSVTWCHGFRTPPFEAHAWLTGRAGEPLGEPPTTTTYQRLLVISPHTNEGISS
ncbi:lasso peptide biosynthesis B2 protein [Actinosynnema sp. CS-041913]|uniref:lasso peptide biosynthesis B2 protein n=1 Tax=Actinosynnema sp. CS-041913 TaxID=3239917 RepID=UPI003D8ABB6A